MKRKKMKRSLITALVLLSMLIAVPACAYAQSSSAETGGYLIMPRSKFNYIIPETSDVVTEIVPKYDDSGNITTTTTPTVKDDDGINKIKEENQRELIRQADMYGSDVVVIKPTEDDDDVSTKIPSSLLDEVSKRPDLELSINTPIGKLVIDADGVLYLAGKSGQDDIVVTIVRDNTPTDKAKEIAGDDGIVYRVIITIGGKEIDTVNGTITLLLKADGPLLDDDIIAIHLKDGEEQELSNNRYDKDGGNWITVKTSAAGTYILANKDKDDSITKPEKPSNSEHAGSNGGKGNQSNSSNAGKGEYGNGTVPVTGDANSLVLYLLLMLLSAGTLLAAIKRVDK